MRTFEKIIIHCSATEPDHDVTAADIDRWHRQRGFDSIGYHFFIRLNGDIERGRPVAEMGAHCKGHNADSIGICYAGGVENGKPSDTMSMVQEMNLIHLIDMLRRVFGPLSVHGHNEFSSKACPSFDVSKKFPWYNEKTSS